MGPGKAELLAQIAETGSISGAARAMGMSYRRAWLLVDTMNRCFDAPLVETHPGGGKSAGAGLTDRGEAMVSAYRELVAALENNASTTAAKQAIETAMRKEPEAG
jgi:molybdate transport system regulatory protein